jgi:hypothetical protein
MKGHAKTVGELRDAMRGLPDDAPIDYKFWPVNLDPGKSVIDGNPRQHGVTFEADRNGIEIAPPPEYGKVSGSR